MNKIYAGIGSRKTPADILQYMYEVAKILSDVGYTLRSGGGQGADCAFENGHRSANGHRGEEPTNKLEVYLPWKDFNNNASTRCYSSKNIMSIAENIHPNWQACNHKARLFHSRNVQIILGNIANGPPVDFVLCWTPGGDIIGGTAMGINVAHKYNIPVYNLGGPGVNIFNSRLIEILNIESNQ